MNISLIASFYRVQAHLSTWVARAEALASHVQKAGITLEFVIIANDAQDDERTLIDAFSAHVSNVNVLYVPRESLYASWNRGVQAARGALIGFWNADDARNTQAVLDAWRLCQAGAKVIYFPWTVIRLDAKGHGRHEQQVYSQIPFDADFQKRKFRAGPFFMFTPALYKQVGGFDERFRIIGDWEWCNRAMTHTNFTSSRVNGGEFYVHGENLSNTGSTRQRCEENVMRILGGIADDIAPAPPDEMKTIWSAWEHDHSISPAVAEKLWGAGASEAWASWQIEEPRRKTMIAREQQLRALPKWLIDTLNLRPLLARFGIVKARPSNE
jgi:hypothetical protein